MSKINNQGKQKRNVRGKKCALALNASSRIIFAHPIFQILSRFPSRLGINLNLKKIFQRKNEFKKM